jgi:hypothetical protein
MLVDEMMKIFPRRPAALLLPMLYLAPPWLYGIDEQVLVASMVTASNWVVGAQLQQSGVMLRTPEGWRLRGYPHPIVVAAVADPREASTLWLAAGNGAIRAARGARDWRIMTDHTVTELRDLAVDANAPGTIYIGHTLGVGMSRDQGRTWLDVTGTRKRRYTEAIAVDRTTAGRILAGGEDGLWLSEDSGRTWRLAGASGYQVMRIRQSPHDPKDWIAVTSKGGPYRSRDGGKTFEGILHLGVGRYLGEDRNSYDVAYDPTTKGRIALSIWGVGIAVTEDDGAKWEWRNHGLPRLELWSCIFDPARPGRLYVSVHEEALYVSEHAGKQWVKEGLDGSVVFQLSWAPREVLQ